MEKEDPRVITKYPLRGFKITKKVYEKFRFGHGQESQKTFSNALVGLAYVSHY